MLAGLRKQIPWDGCLILCRFVQTHGAPGEELCRRRVNQPMLVRLIIATGSATGVGPDRQRVQWYPEAMSMGWREASGTGAGTSEAAVRASSRAGEPLAARYQ